VTRMSRRLFLLSVALLALRCATQFARDPAAIAHRLCAESPSVDTTVFDTTQVSQKPEITGGPPPSYPDDLRRRHISGRVVMAVVIDVHGRAELRTIQIIRSDNSGFEMSVRRYVASATFLPGCREGHAVRVRVAIPVDFRVMP
jgi:periplasmic protein TonB